MGKTMGEKRPAADSQSPPARRRILDIEGPPQFVRGIRGSDALRPYYSGATFEIPQGGLRVEDHPLEETISETQIHDFDDVVSSSEITDERSVFADKQYVGPKSIFDYHENVYDSKHYHYPHHPLTQRCSNQLCFCNRPFGRRDTDVGDTNMMESEDGLRHRQEMREMIDNVFAEIFDVSQDTGPSTSAHYQSLIGVDEGTPTRSAFEEERIGEIEVNLFPNIAYKDMSATEASLDSSLMESIEESLSQFRKSSFFRSSPALNKGDIKSRQSQPKPPSFTKVLLPQFVHEGSDVVFKCEVYANPLPKITWTAGDKSSTDKNKRLSLEQALGDKSRYTIKYSYPTCELIIHSATPNDVNVYTCEAINNIGNAMTSTSLNVWPCEGEPGSLRAENESLNSDSLPYSVTSEDLKDSSSSNQFYVFPKGPRKRRRTRITNIIQEILADETFEEGDSEMGEGDEEFYSVAESGFVKEVKIDFEKGVVSKDEQDAIIADLSSEELYEKEELIVDKVSPKSSGTSSSESVAEDVPYGSSITPNIETDISQLSEISKDIKELDSFTQDLNERVSSKIVESIVRKYSDDISISPAEETGVGEEQEGGRAPSFTVTMEPVKVNEFDTVVIKLKCDGEPYPDIKWFKGPDVMLQKEMHIEKKVESTEIITDRVFYQYDYPDIILYIRNISRSDDDIYTCVATNQYGKACTSSSVSVYSTEEAESLFSLKSKKESYQLAKKEGEKMPDISTSSSDDSDSSSDESEG